MGERTLSIEIVTYDGLPVSKGGAHWMHTRRASRGMEAFERFLEACVVPASPVRWGFDVCFSERPEGESALERAIAETLGNRSFRTPAFDGWDVPEDLLGDALALLDVKRAPELRAPAHLHPLLTGTVSGVLRDPESGEGYAGVSPEACGGFPINGYGTALGAVSTRVMLEPHSAHLSLHLSLPGDTRLVAATRHVQEHLPFALSEKHWMRWVPARGGGYRARRQRSPLAVA